MTTVLTGDRIDGAVDVVVGLSLPAFYLLVWALLRRREPARSHAEPRKLWHWLFPVNPLYGIVAAFVLAAVITPSVNPLTQTLIALPLVVAYMTTWAVRWRS